MTKMVCVNHFFLCGSFVFQIALYLDQPFVFQPMSVISTREYLTDMETGLCYC